MPLKELFIGGSKVADLAPLRGMSLVNFNCNYTNVTSLAPLRGMPIKVIWCEFEKLKRHAAILRSIKTLEKINNEPPAEFWKKVAAK